VGLQEMETEVIVGFDGVTGFEPPPPPPHETSVTATNKTNKTNETHFFTTPP